MFKHLYKATKWSLEGLVTAYKTQAAFRLELWVVLFLTVIAFYIALNLNQLLWLVFSAHLILIVELINSAIEASIDHVHKSKDQWSKFAKDAGSAAVFYSILLALTVWLLIIWINCHSVKIIVI